VDQSEPDDTISLRDHVRRLRPAEAAAAFDAAPAEVFRSDLNLQSNGFSAIDPEYEQALNEQMPSFVIARSSLRAGAEAVVEDAAAGRSSILLGNDRVPSSFFADRATAIELIERALEHDDPQFRVLTKADRTSAANAIDDGELIRRVVCRPAEQTVRAAIIANISSDMTGQEQDTIVHRVQRKLRKRLKT
jgi:hypothetical protein